MGYRKGQFEAAVLAAIALLIIFILIFGILAAKIGILIFLFLKVMGSAEPKKKTTLVPVLILVAILVVGEFFPEIIDAPASYIPQLCVLHYAFPLHFVLDLDTMESCSIGAAIQYKDPSLCPPELSSNMAVTCVGESILAGGRDCSGAKVATDYCRWVLAEETANVSVCGEIAGPERVSCITKMIRNNRSMVNCSGLGISMLEEFCNEAYDLSGKGECLGSSSVIVCNQYISIDQVTCIANMSRNPSFCQLVQHKQEDCYTLIAVETSSPTVCERQKDLYEGGCIYCVLNSTDYNAPCSVFNDNKLEGFCEALKEAARNDTCVNITSPRKAGQCIVDYTNNESYCSFAVSPGSCIRETEGK